LQTPEAKPTTLELDSANADGQDESWHVVARGDELIITQMTTFKIPRPKKQTLSPYFAK
jgi:hypothetical protein